MGGARERLMKMPCPFCASASLDVVGRDSVRVRCRVCGCEGPAVPRAGMPLSEARAQAADVWDVRYSGAEHALLEESWRERFTQRRNGKGGCDGVRI